MDIQPLEILTWIGIVLAAAFVGYFGRYLAIVIISRLHKKSLEKGSVVATVNEEPAACNRYK